MARQHTLLVVDDEEPNRDFLAQRLTKRGYRVLQAESGPDALDAVEREAVDLVLLDVMMPEMDGLEVLRTLRRTHPPLDLPVVMVTACADSGDVVAALAAGANDHVSKPIDFAVLLARVQNQLSNRSALASARSAAPAAAPAPPPTLRAEAIGPGAIVDGKYKIEARIGSGGFGVVYRARHIHLDRVVAVKFLEGPWAARPETRERFRVEGVSACRVHHPNAVLVFDYGLVGDVAYLVMELLSGRPLSDELTRVGRLPVPRCLEIGAAVASVLAAAHRAGIIHRDIKPANVFLHQSEEGEVIKVLDFGIAKLLGGDETTRPGSVIGTPEYMAPERFRGVGSDPSLDVYSLGTMLYKMLSGGLPFEADTQEPMELAHQKLVTDAPPLAPLCPDVPADLADLVMRTVKRAPGERPSAAELTAALSRLLDRESARGSVEPSAGKR